MLLAWVGGTRQGERNLERRIWKRREEVFGLGWARLGRVLVRD